jgi:hypothetical protein
MFAAHMYSCACDRGSARVGYWTRGRVKLTTAIMRLRPRLSAVDLVSSQLASYQGREHGEQQQ